MAKTKNIFISGINGNMGQRYMYVLRALGHTVYGLDKEFSFTEQAHLVQKSDNKIDGIIIATPTPTHLDALMAFMDMEDIKPILCEKPISTNPITLPLFDNISMVNQYKYLLSEKAMDSDKMSYYNYFKTGKDSLAWDCINIIGLANGPIAINNGSYKWNCIINGERIDFRRMDYSYYLMVKDWIKNPVADIDYIEYAHNKVLDFLSLSEKKVSGRVKKSNEPHLRVIK